jgi:peptide/nickel transport system permease protein
MRLAGDMMSFPLLLIAVIVLYLLDSFIINPMAMLAIIQIHVYLRTTSAEVLEVRERMYVHAAPVMDASQPAHTAGRPADTLSAGRR